MILQNNDQASSSTQLVYGVIFLGTQVPVKYNNPVKGLFFEEKSERI